MTREIHRACSRGWLADRFGRLGSVSEDFGFRKLLFQLLGALSKI